MVSQTQSQRHRDEILSHEQWRRNLGPISVAVTLPYCQRQSGRLIMGPSLFIITGRVGGGVLYIGEVRINYLQINGLGHWLLTDYLLLLLKMYFPPPPPQGVALFSFSLWIAAYRSKKRKPQLYKPADFLIKEPVLNLFILLIPNEFKMVAS